MKKSVIALGAAALFAFASCKEDKNVPEPAPKTPPVENPTPPPSPTTNAPAAEKQDDAGTSVSVSKDGVQVKTKDETNKTDVDVSKNGAAVEIKKSKS